MKPSLSTLVARLTRSEAPPAGAVGPDQLTVMVVDDEESIRRYVDRVLRRAGFSPSLAMSGPEGIRAACRMPKLDLLITDLMMPEMGGEEMVRQLRTYHPGLKVLYLSGFTGRLFERTAVLENGQAFLGKPCSASELEEAISQLMYGRLGIVQPRLAAGVAPFIPAEDRDGQASGTMHAG